MHGLMAQADWRKNRVNGGTSGPPRQIPPATPQSATAFSWWKLLKKPNDDVDLGWSGRLLHWWTSRLGHRWRWL